LRNSQRFKTSFSARAILTASIKVRGDSLNNPRDSWEEIKEQLIARFGETTDHRQSFFILRNRRQKSDETIQAFSDELFTLSRKAYPNLRGHEAFIETELIEIFIDGLRSPELQLKLLRESPRTLMDAVKIALAENDVLKRWELRKGRASSEKEIQNICPLLIDRRLILLHYHLSYLCKRIVLLHLTNFLNLLENHQMFLLL
jgi:hypothetical protein